MATLENTVFSLQNFGGETTPTRSIIRLGEYVIGMDFGSGLGNYWEDIFPAEYPTIDALLVGHGHADHCASIPLLEVNKRLSDKAKIYGTDITLAHTIMHAKDGIRINTGIHDNLIKDARKRAKKDWDARDELGLKGVGSQDALKKRYESKVPKLPYDTSDVNAIRDRFKHVDYHERTLVAGDSDKGVYATYLNGGHIPGGSQIILEYQEKGNVLHRVLYCVDLGRKKDLPPIVQAPEEVPAGMRFDSVIIESTYGGRANTQVPFEDARAQLEALVRDSLKAGKKVIIPAFGILRSQQAVSMVNDMYANGIIPKGIRTYLDSSQAQKVDEEYRSNPDCMRELYWKKKDMVQPMNVGLDMNLGTNWRAYKPGPYIVIATAGMCNAGTVFSHIFNHDTVDVNGHVIKKSHGIEDMDTVVILTGYQGVDTNGRKILETPQGGEFSVMYYNGKPETFVKNAEVYQIKGMSGHAGGDELADHLKGVNKDAHVYIIHGESDRKELMRQDLQDMGFGNVTVAQLDKLYN